MVVLWRLLDQALKHNRTSRHTHHQFTFHAPNNTYKNINIGLKIPHLPPPLHYLNFYCEIRSEEEPFKLNKSIENYANIHSSVGAPMVGAHSIYNLDSCSFSNREFNFNQKEKILVGHPVFLFQREDDELSYQLHVTPLNTQDYLIKMRLHIATLWSCLCRVVGEVKYKNETYYLNQLGSLEFARSIQSSFISHAFWNYALINIDSNKQLLCVQARTSNNDLLYSYAFIRSENESTSIFFESINFQTYRVYPKIKTQDGDEMYLLREFEWISEHSMVGEMKLFGQVNGDYKFGLGKGFVGSFSYQLNLDGQVYTGDDGYLEYMDCRDLRWQEYEQDEKKLEKKFKFASIMYKKH